MSDSMHLSTQIARPAAEVYAFLADPANLPQWAAGLSGSIEQRDDRWFAESPMGDVEVRFVEENPYGVLDHDVTLPDGTTVTNPMRVIADDNGCEVVFTVRRAAGATDAELQADAAAVRADLATLKQLLE
jgi:Polyketide cyclase / dehydrase and lipid transport